MAPAENGRRPQRKRRAPRACNFCRQRKMRCNNGMPQCGNCAGYGVECKYNELPKRPRLASLEQENQRLKETLERLQPAGRSSGRPESSEQDAAASSSLSLTQSVAGRSPQSTASATPGTINVTVEDDAGEALPPQTRPSSPAANPEETVSVPSPPSREDLAANTGDARYHGPTSTLFDDTEVQDGSNSHQRKTQPAKGRTGGPPTTYWVQKMLLAEAASQRHLETIHLAAGMLDFDGVDPDLGMHLLRLHWNRQHHSFLITYRPAFMRDMACGGPYFSRLLLNAIFFGASKFSNRLEVRRDPNDVRTAGWLFRERVRQLLGGALDRSDITTIQALLVMTSSLFALGDERSAAWLYAGTAFRMIIDLGLHVDGGDGGRLRGCSDEDMEIRRRVFWGAFVVDKIQSLYQGRPVSLQEMETSVPLVFNDGYEELEHWRPFAYAGTAARDYPGSPAYSVSCFTQLCRLALVMNRVLNAVYAERSTRKKPDELADDLKRLHADLQAWKAELPAHLDFDPAKKVSSAGSATSTSPPHIPTPPPHVMSLLAMYNVLLILLHRPFVSDGHLHANLRALSTSSFLICAQAATAIVALLRAYNEAFSVRRAPYLISYATYVAATIHVRIAAQPGSFASEAKHALAMCLMVLDENSETNWAVKRARAVVNGLMHNMGVSIEPVEIENASRLRERQADTSSETRGETRARDSNASTVPLLPQLQDQHYLDTRVAEPLQPPTPRQSHGTTPMDMPTLASTGPSSSTLPVTAAAATFDIEAIISSFISDQQPPLAAAFKSLPAPPGPQYAGTYPPHTVATYASPLRTTSVGGSLPAGNPPHHQPWYPLPPSSNGLYTVLPPDQTAAASPLQNAARLDHFRANGNHAMTPMHQAIPDGGNSNTPTGDWPMGGVEPEPPNVNARDMLFGFHSSAVDGIGWEFEGGMSMMS